MLLAIGCAHLIRDVVDGGGDQIIIIDEHGGCEYQIEFHRTTRHSIIGVGGQHVHALLHSGLHLDVIGLDIAIESEVGIGSTRGVVAMCSNHILACMKEFLEVGIQMEYHIVHPGLARGNHFLAVDEELEHIVMRVFHIEVGSQLLGRELHLATDIDIATLLAPLVAYEVESVGPPSSLFLFPIAHVGVFLGPSVGLNFMSHEALPALFVGHGSDGLKHIFGGLTHETISGSVHSQVTHQRFLGIGPVACGSVCEFVKG